jgi:hypothetical protein
MSKARTPNGRGFHTEFQARGKAARAKESSDARTANRTPQVGRSNQRYSTSGALEDYFEGNNEETSIAPNQVGEGRPSLERMYGILKAIKARPDVQTVVVGLHSEWTDAMNDPDLWPAGEHIHIYTTAKSQNRLKLKIG